MIKERIMVFDTNWYLHRCAATIKSSRPIEEVLPYQVLSMMCKDAVAVKADYVLAAFDGPSVFRYSIYPEYKSGRNKDKKTGKINQEVMIRKENIYKCLPFVYALLDSIGMCYYQPKKREADDVLKSVVHYYVPLGYSIICGTQDKDAYQYLQPGVRLYDSSAKGKDGKSKPRYITQEMAEKQKGVQCCQMIDYQTLIGDKGDSVPGLTGVGPVKAKTILNEYGSIARWYKKSKEDRSFIDSQQDALRRNRRLVTLTTDCLPPQELEQWKLLKDKPKDKNLSRSFHELYDSFYPKSKGLFK